MPTFMGNKKKITINNIEYSNLNQPNISQTTLADVYKHKYIQNASLTQMNSNPITLKPNSQY